MFRIDGGPFAGALLLALAVGLSSAPAYAGWLPFGKKDGTPAKADRAKTEDPDEEDAPERAVTDTRHCPYSLFTSKDDAIDFTGGRSQACFDMLSGDDTLVLDRSMSPGEVRIYSGRGRDRVFATDRADRIEDADGQDSAIHAFGGDDEIHINLGVDKDPLRGVEMTGQTNLYPGAGRNVISIGENHDTDAFARVSPNLRMWVDAAAQDTITSTCGRPTMDELMDVRVMEVPPHATLSARVMGCGMGYFGVRGAIDVEQDGGRFALSTIGSDFLDRKSVHLPQLEALVRAGTSAFIEIDGVTPESQLSWDGSDIALVKALSGDESQGGVFQVRSSGDVHGEFETGLGSALWTLASERRIEMRLDVTGDAHDEIIRLAAPDMSVTIDFRTLGAVPEISNTASVTLPRSRMVAPDFEYFDGETLAEKARQLLEDLLSREKTGEGVPLPEGVDDMALETEGVKIEPGRSRLALILRHERMEGGLCANVTLVDFEAPEGDVSLACAGPDAPTSRFTSPEAGRFDEVRIEVDEETRIIALNGDTALRVDELVVTY